MLTAQERYARRSVSRVVRYGALCRMRGHRECKRIRALVLVPGAECWMCLGPADTLDHYIPLNRSGRHCLRRNLILPACRSCNSSRGSLTVEEWFATA